MKISTEIHPVSIFLGEEKAIELVAKAGFDAWDYSFFRMVSYDWNTSTCIVDQDCPMVKGDYLKYARQLKKVGEDNGIICNQAHAPFPSHDKTIFSLLQKSIEGAAEAGAEVIVVHPVNKNSAEENAEIFFKILPFAKECGIKIATENMWEWGKDVDYALPMACGTKESFAAHLDAVNDPFFTACLDIGHAEMMKDGTTAVGIINYLKDRIGALHVHDNDKLHDTHWIPLSMNIDFKPIMTALKKTGYKGYLTLECDGYMYRLGKDGAEEGFKNLYAAAKKLSDIFEEA